MNKQELDNFPGADLFFGKTIFNEMRSLVARTPLAWSKTLPELGFELSGHACRFLSEARFAPAGKTPSGAEVLAGTVGAEGPDDPDFSFCLALFEPGQASGSCFHIWRDARWCYLCGIPVHKTAGRFSAGAPYSQQELGAMANDERLIGAFLEASPDIAAGAFAAHQKSSDAAPAPAKKRAPA